jgi:hypothetical protein
MALKIPAPPRANPLRSEPPRTVTLYKVWFAGWKFPTRKGAGRGQKMRKPAPCPPLIGVTGSVYIYIYISCSQYSSAFSNFSFFSQYPRRLHPISFSAFTLRLSPLHSSSLPSSLSSAKSEWVSGFQWKGKQFLRAIRPDF